MAISERVKNIRIAQVMRFNLLGRVNHRHWHKAHISHTEDPDDVVLDECNTRLAYPSERIPKQFCEDEHVNIARLRKFANFVINNFIYQIFVLILIHLGFLLFIFDTCYEEILESTHFVLARAVVDYILLPIFILSICEIVLQWIIDFKGFWKDYFNIVDLTLTILALIPHVMLVTMDTSSVARMEDIEFMKKFRVLFTLKVIPRVEGFRRLVVLVFKTLQKMKNILVNFLIISYTFATSGVLFFKDFGDEAHLSGTNGTDAHFVMEPHLADHTQAYTHSFK
uniref:cation channel sperm-associated protein 2-like n=1 Tax=Myxine glutinosa TaxID=7769 RepID=UPI00358E9A43